MESALAGSMERCHISRFVLYPSLSLPPVPSLLAYVYILCWALLCLRQSFLYRVPPPPWSEVDRHLLALAFLDQLWFPEIGDREDNIKPAHAKTFEWLLDVNSRKSDACDFMNWLLSPCDVGDSNRIFWVSGKAGSGKSTLMKYLYRDQRLKSCLEVWAGRIPLTCIGFFIWDRGKSMMHKSREGMVRSLLHQFLAQYKSLIPAVFTDKWMTVEDWTKLENPPTWRWPELYAALKLVTDDTFLKEQDIDTRLCIFVDGMDEYITFRDLDLSPNEIINQKKKGYAEITELFKQLAKSSITKICLSSRPLVDFKDAFGVTGHQLILEKLTYDDIKSYTTETLRGNHRWRAMSTQSPLVAEQFITNIVDKALGVFLWVELVVGLLLKGLQDGDRLKELQRKLDSMPVELGGENGLYALMMRNIQVEHRRQCFEILQLVRYSLSPPTSHGLAFADGEYQDLLFKEIETTSLLQVNQAQYTSRRLDDRLSSRCAGLLELVMMEENCYGPQSATRSIQRVQFMHQTAKDFAEQPEMWKVFLPDPLGDFNPHASLLASCVLELKLGNPLNGQSIGCSVVMPSERRARVWKMVKDAMLYASRDEQCRSNQIDSVVRFQRLLTFDKFLIAQIQGY